MVMEITESALMKGPHDVRDILFRLRDQGVKISIDDFGTGYSSLAYLAELPIDELKIDRRFIDGSESDSRKQALIDAMLNIGRSLGLEVVAEGVETEQQSQFLKDKGCNLLQGFLFHKPQDADSITALLGANSQ
ncbi:MAG: EAL domain-containing protein [Motiliproteus sp.]